MSWSSPNASSFVRQSGALIATLALLIPVVVAAQEGHWDEFGPPIRSGHTLVYDSIADRLILFGGHHSTYGGDGAEHGDVWTMALSAPDPSWIRLDMPGPHPAARKYHSAAFDPVGNRMIVFGGSANYQVMGDTWSLNLSGAPRWTRLEFANSSPPNRADGAFLYDPVANRMVLLGGGGEGFPLRSDVWTLDLSGTPEWQPLAIAPYSSHPVPPYQPVHGHRAIYDPLSGHVIVVGQGTYWHFDLRSATPAWQSMGSSPLGGDLVFDPESRRVYSTDGLGVRVTTLDYGEYLSLGLVRRPHPVTLGVGAPKADVGQASVFDPVRRRLLTYGGISSRSQLRGPLDGVLWSFDPAAGRWSSVGSPAVPTNMNRPLLLRDELRDRLILWGDGDADQGQILARGFQGGSNWSFVADSAWVRDHDLSYYASAAYDSRRDRILVYERVPAAAATPVRSISLATSPPQSAVLPATNANPMMTAPVAGDGNGAIYDAARDRFVVFGLGSDAHEAWSLSLDGPSTWSRLDAPSGPRPAFVGGESWIHDRAGDRILLLTGPASVWTLGLDGTSGWTPLATVGSPPFIGTMTATYDAVRNRVVVHEREETWALDLAGTPTWHDLDVVGAGQPVTWAAGLSDPLRDQVVYFGSYDVYQSMWALRFEGLPTATLPTILDANAEGNAIRVRWSVSDATGPCSVERAEGGEAWSLRESRSADATGIVDFLDHAVVAGVEYSYRLRIPTREGELVTDPVNVTAEGTAPRSLALSGIRPNPSVGALHVSFEAAGRGPARIDVIDLSGRRVNGIELANVEPGHHVVTIEPGSLSAGVYFLRLRHDGADAVRRFVRL